jgi:acyl-homoserine-lactone acylase
MRFRARASSLVLLVVLASSAVLLSQATRTAAPAAGNRAAAAATDILWDRWGVPHIFAASPADAFYAFGFAQMESHGDLMLRLYGQARGRGAEYWGRDYLDMDKYVRTMGVPSRAREWVAQQTPTFRPLLDAFVAGVNDYGRQHPERLNKDVQVVLPIEAADVLAHVQRVLSFTFVSNPQLVQGTADRWNRGSNTWAVAPKRTAGGHALLLVNPHLPWGDLFSWYEAQISVGDVNAYGAALVGMPLLSIAFNDALGWSHTNNTMDGSDL